MFIRKILESKKTILFISLIFTILLISLVLFVISNSSQVIYSNISNVTPDSVKVIILKNNQNTNNIGLTLIDRSTGKNELYTKSYEQLGNFDLIGLTNLSKGKDYELIIEKNIVSGSKEYRFQFRTPNSDLLPIIPDQTYGNVSDTDVSSSIILLERTGYYPIMGKVDENGKFSLNKNSSINTSSLSYIASTPRESYSLKYISKRGVFSYNATNGNDKPFSIENEKTSGLLNKNISKNVVAKEANDDTGSGISPQVTQKPYETEYFDLGTNNESSVTSYYPPEVKEAKSVVDDVYKTVPQEDNFNNNTPSVNNESSISASQPKSGEPVPADCTDIVDIKTRVECKKKSDDTKLASEAKAVEKTNESVCSTSGDYCNGGVKVSCISNGKVLSTKSCADIGMVCCQMPQGVPDVCAKTCPKTETKPETNAKVVVEKGNLCDQYLNPLNDDKYTLCCYHNPSSKACSTQSLEVKGTKLINQYDDYIVNTLGLGKYSCGLVAVASSLDQLGIKDYKKTLEEISKITGTYGYSPTGGISYMNLVELAKKLTTNTDIGIKTNDYSDSSAFLNQIKTDLQDGKNLVTLFAFADNGKGTIPIKSVNGDPRRHYARITGYDPITKTIKLEENQAPGIAGRQTEVIVKEEDFVNSVVKMSGTNLWLMSLGKDNGKVDQNLAKVDNKEGVISIGVRGTSSSISQNTNSNVLGVTETPIKVNFAENGKYSITLKNYKLFNPIIPIDVENEYTLKFFDDRNGDGAKQLEEPDVLGVSDYTIDKISEDVVYDLKEGWNLVGFSVPGNNKYASDIFTEISRQGGYSTQISTYENGEWKGLVQRAGIKFGDDFEITNKAVFIRVIKPLKLTVTGKKVEKSEVKFVKGWNLINYRTDTFKSSDNAEKYIINYPEIDIVTKFQGGRYESYIKDKDTVFGTSYKLEENAGYFVRKF